jgi:hypothetical protein
MIRVVVKEKPGIVHLVDADEPWDGERTEVILCAARVTARVWRQSDGYMRVCARCLRMRGILLS